MSHTIQTLVHPKTSVNIPTHSSSRRARFLLSPAYPSSLPHPQSLHTHTPNTALTPPQALVSSTRPSQCRDYTTTRHAYKTRLRDIRCRHSGPRYLTPRHSSHSPGNWMRTDRYAAGQSCHWSRRLLWEYMRYPLHWDGVWWRDSNCTFTEDTRAVA
jgi:hypothetical protein